MTKRAAISRITFGLILLAVMYAGPCAYGLATSGGKLADCLRNASRPTDVVVKLSYIPGPTQLEDLQRYGRYGGSGGELNNVVLLGVPPRNITLVSRLYWVDSVEPEHPC